MLNYESFKRELFDYVQDADFGHPVVTNYYKEGQQLTNEVDVAFALPFLNEKNTITTDCVSVAPVLPDVVTSRFPTSSGDKRGVIGATGFCIPAEILYDIYKAVTKDRGEKHAWLGVNAFIRKGLESFESEAIRAIDHGITEEYVSLDYNELLQIVDALSVDHSLPPTAPHMPLEEVSGDSGELEPDLVSSINAQFSHISDIVGERISAIPTAGIPYIEMQIVEYDCCHYVYLCNQAERRLIVRSVLKSHNYTSYPSSTSLPHEVIKDLVLFPVIPLEEAFRSDGLKQIDGAFGPYADLMRQDAKLLRDAANYLRRNRMSRELEAWGREVYRLILKGER